MGEILRCNICTGEQRERCDELFAQAGTELDGLDSKLANNSKFDVLSPTNYSTAQEHEIRTNLYAALATSCGNSLAKIRDNIRDEQAWRQNG